VADIDREDIDALIACLGDDAAKIRSELANCRPNGEGFICKEWAESMERAAELMQRLADDNAAVARLLLDRDHGGAVAWAKGLRISMDGNGGLTANADDFAATERK
jgi:hypothetical protein